MMNNNYRIHTNISSDTVLKVNFQQDYDCLEILSLKISQEDLYKFTTSNYGVIIGRVLANDAFGVPNAKVSVFIPLDDEDKERTEIVNLYNFKELSDTNKDNIRYNLLPDEMDDDCYRVVGSFPNKRLVLDDNTVLEIFDKYYKYTTVTNNAGDYMLYGVPTGSTMLHVDLDLSDIGVLSQKPRDFMYKGYTETQFDSSEQFKESTNLGNLSQIISQDQGVYTYPFISEEGAEDAAITRADIQIQYKFEPTCVFFGSVVTDTAGNNIRHNCTPSRHIGENSRLVTGNGTIEMIRKTLDGLTEEYQIQGNQLIDGDGVWCYQIPMNLDYVGTDEYGNICATDNPNKGIPTRTRVRFRMSVSETENDAVSRHRAKFLVPNNPKMMSGESEPMIDELHARSFDKHYNFGTSTQDEDYRDLYWNKVYSIKSYIPRVQTVGRVKTYNYTGLKTANNHGDNNPIPFNRCRFRLPFAYMLLCVIVKIVIWIICFINQFILGVLYDLFANRMCFWVFKKICPFKFLAKYFTCIAFGAGLTDSDDSNEAFYPCCENEDQLKNSDCPEGMDGCKKNNSTKDLFDIVEQALAAEYDVVHLDFYNDWINGVLYFPQWHWKKRKKKSYFFGLFRRRAINSYCECDKEWSRLRTMDLCTLDYGGARNDNGSKWYQKKRYDYTFWGLIKNIINKDGLNLYYYAPGIIRQENVHTEGQKLFTRLFATDIILLGTFNSCDLEGVPQPFNNLPSTTANIPDIVRVLKQINDDENDTSTEGTTEEKGEYIEVNGMDWLHDPKKQDPKYSQGLLFGLDCTEVYTLPKTCVNLKRLSELGVNLDITYEEQLDANNLKETVLADGVITKVDLDDYETRAMFATLNHNGLQNQKIDPTTSYKIYNYRYVYPVDFDGTHNEKLLLSYNITQKDLMDYDYELFKYGPDYENSIIHNYGGKKVQQNGKNEFFPLTNNSFYFYFGLKEGKTAIDKFRKKFTATCFQNKKEPFTIDVTKVSPKYCDSVGTSVENCDDNIVPERSGVIDVSLPDIQLPLSYTLRVQETQDIILQETNITINRLIFGVKLEKNQKYLSGNTYIDDEGNGYEKDGCFHAFKSYPKIVWVDEKTDTDNIVIKLTKDKPGTNFNKLRIEPKTYLLSITDANGKTIEQTITLEQSLIDLKFGVTPLGEKYIPKEVNDEKIYYTKEREIFEHGTYGLLNISGLTIDGDEYIINDAILEGLEDKVENTENLYTKYRLKCESVDLNPPAKYDVMLKIGIRSLLFPQDLRHQGSVSFHNSSSICAVDTPQDDVDIIHNNTNGLGDVCCFQNGQFSYHIWVPSTLTIVVNQYCCGELNDNRSTYTARINNGELFDVFINSMPLRFIYGFQTEENSFNKVFQPNGASFYQWFFQKVPQDIENENKFNYYPNLLENEALWSNYIDYTTEYDDAFIKHPTTKTKLDALVFKMNTLLELGNTVYFTEDGSKFKYRVTGGRDNINQLYRPEYTEFSSREIYYKPEKEETGIDYERSQLNRWTLDTDKTVTYDGCHPNVVNKITYKYFRRKYVNRLDDRYPIKFIDICQNDIQMNPLIHVNSSIYNLSVNYFVAFTNNGYLNCNTKYASIPPKDVKLWTIGDGCDAMRLDKFVNKPVDRDPATNQSKIYYWFQSETIDRRMAYEMTIFSSTDLFKGTLEGLGRIVLKTKNGIEMGYDIDNGSYDDGYNIFQKIENEDIPEYEYYYLKRELENSDDITPYYTFKNEYLNKKNQKYFYDMTFVADLMDYDFRKMMYQKDKGQSDNILYYDNRNKKNNSVGTPEKPGKNPYFALPPDINGIQDTTDNYPIIRYADVVAIPIHNEVEFGFQSCAYQGSTMTNFKNSASDYTEADITVTIKGGERIENSITFRDFYTYKNNSLQSCADTGDFNVLLDWNGKPLGLRLACKINKDEDTDIRNYTYRRPFFLTFDSLIDFKDFITNCKLKTNQNQPFTDIYKVAAVGGYGGNVKMAMLNKSTEVQNTVTHINDKSWPPNIQNWTYIFDKDEKIITYETNPEIFETMEFYIDPVDCQGKPYYIPDEYYGWGLTPTDTYKIKEIAKIPTCINYLMIFGAREYYDINIDNLLERRIYAFDFNKSYNFNVKYTYNPEFPIGTKTDTYHNMDVKLDLKLEGTTEIPPTEDTGTTTEASTKIDDKGSTGKTQEKYCTVVFKNLHIYTENELGEKSDITPEIYDSVTAHLWSQDYYGRILQIDDSMDVVAKPTGIDFAFVVKDGVYEGVIEDNFKKGYPIYFNLLFKYNGLIYGYPIKITQING